ncbi:MAG TPA: S8 family serine peptidase [Acidimicrobiales bacterium]|nr:S8 family serine peptidase [Acidimicrobiales bacterium]
MAASRGRPGDARRHRCSASRPPTAWDVAHTGATIVVAVLDTGVDLDHPDLAPNLVPGYDAVAEDTVPMDDEGHGTQVAGVVGAATDNGIGVAGVAWNTKIMPVKVLNAEGLGTDADIAQGIVWATDHGAGVVNLSLGGPGGSAVIDSAVDYALQHEVVVVAAAGNASSPALFYPAGAPGVLGVTATDAAGRFAWFSNHGPWYLLSAPGIGVRTTALTAGTAGAYTSSTGTSFSSPIVAGVAALVLERHPGWGWFETADELIRTARDAGPAGVDDAYGFGIVDASAALGVSPRGATSRPNLSGDAGNLQSAARAISTGAAASEAIGYEYDEDWFAFDVPAQSGATITVTPPVASGAPRAAELDPIVELYGPGGGLVSRVDDTFEGQAEALSINLGVGRHTVRVTNYMASAGPGPYTVQAALGAPVPSSAWAPRQDVFDANASEQAVAVADFNADGRDDVAMASGSASDVANQYKLFVFTQGADGTLGSPVRIATHAGSPLNGDPLRAVDLDGDGDTDVVRGTASGVEVAWNDGGVLTDAVLYPTGGAVGRIQVADLDGAAPAELIVQGTGGLQVVRWADGDVAVEPVGLSAPATWSGIGFDVADLTGDGRRDIAMLEGAAVAIHAQEPDGSWAAPVTVDLPGLDTSALSKALATSDLDGDGRADIVVTSAWNAGSWGGAGARLAYTTQQPDASFGPLTMLATQGGGPGALKIGDVTAHGRADVAVLHNGGDVGVFRQTAGGTLAAEHPMDGASATTFLSPDSLGIGDLDGDGVGDLAVAGYNVGLSLFTHQAAVAVEGAGPWVAATSPAEHATGVATTVRPSVTFGRDVAPSSVNANTVALIDGRDGHVVPTTLARSGRTVTLTPAARLQAGAPYVVWVVGVTDPTGADFAYEQVPFTTVGAASPRYDITRTLRPFHIDLDGNGFDDIFWYAPGDAVDSIWFHGTDGRVGVNTQVIGTYTPLAGDFDGNGYDDIFWYGPGSGTDVMWWNSRAGIRSEVVPVLGVYVPLVGDFDRNGFDDIFWYGPGSGPDSAWYFGPAGRRGVAQSVTGSSYRPAAGDFNRDGYDDIVWYAPGSGSESLWRGRASGFAKGSTMSITGTYRALPLDHNADGFEEVFLYTTNRGIFWKSGTSGFPSVLNGPSPPSGTRPVAGDFTGDVRDDLLVYVPGSPTDPLYRGTSSGVG